MNFAQSNYHPAKKPDFKFKSFSIEEGLSQSNVRCILQDKQGFLWLGTQDGLNRYDGYEFIVFRNIIGDSNSLSHNYIYDLAEDKEGNIWIATGGGGISRYKPSTNSFKNYKKDKDNLNLITTLSIYVDSNNQIWAGTYLIGLSKYDSLTDSFISYVYDKNNPNGIPSKTIISICEDKKRNLWLSSDDAGLIKFNQIKSTFTNYTENDGLIFNYVNSVKKDKNGNIIIGTLGGLSILDTEGNFRNFKSNLNVPGSLISNKIKTVFPRRNGDILIGTEDAGINYFIPKESTFYNYKAEDKTAYPISDNIIFSFHEDNSGIVWIGTGRGLNKIENYKKFSTLLGPETEKPLSGNNVWSILEDSNNNLWAGTDKGLFKISGRNGSVKKIKGTSANNLDNKIIYSLSQDNDGNIWAGTNSGLYFINILNNKISTYINNSHGDESYYYNIIRSVYVDSDKVLLGTNARGLEKFSIDRKEFYPFKPSNSQIDLFNKYTVFKSYKDKKGDFWFCTTFGLFHLESKTNELKSVISALDEKTYDLTKIYNQSLCFYEGNDFFWVGTSGGGLIKLIPDRNIVIRYLEQDGLSNNIVYGILPDNNGNLWLSTNNGLSKFNIKDETFRNYNITDGLPSDEFNVGAYLKSSSGKLYFGGINGIVAFNPDEIKDNRNPPPVTITGFRVFDKPFYNKLYFNENETIELSYADNFFSFEFAALDFTNPGKNEYAYMLEGFDKEWNYIGNRRFASYTNIDPGEYTFRVKASNNDGFWNESGVSLIVIITPPFYSTWWAYTLYAIIFIAALFSIRQYEINKRKRKEELILKEEKEKAKLRETALRAETAELKTIALRSKKEIEKQIIRARIASDLHDEIGSNLSGITLLSEILTDKLSKIILGEKNDILQKLQEINAVSKASAESMRDIVWFINPLSDPMKNLFSRMKQTAASILGDIDYKFKTDKQLYNEKINPELKRNIYLIYKETLGNIIKHSKADKVNISATKKGNNFSIIIEDNGIGFDIEKAEMGNGLQNIKLRSSKINGKIEINSSPGKGTIIKLTVKTA